MIPDARDGQDTFDGLKPCSKCGGRPPLAAFPPQRSDPLGPLQLVPCLP